MREVEQSLRRLRTDYLDIYFLHSPDEDLFRDDGLEALVRLKEQGKIRATGFSVMSVDEGIPLAMRLIEQGAGRRHVQQAYRLLYTLPTKELFPLAQARNVGVIARENFYFGFLTGAITRETVFDDHDDRRKFSPAFIDAVLARVEKLGFSHQRADDDAGRAAVRACHTGCSRRDPRGDDGCGSRGQRTGFGRQSNYCRGDGADHDLWKRATTICR